jgi:hypothetical protein
MTRLHRRQFALGPRPLFERHVELAPGLLLSYDPDLPVHVDGSTALLGVAVQTLEGRPDPERELAGEQDWAGRWALVRDGVLIPDATASLALFYDGELASSSAALLAAGRAARPPLAHGVGMDWYPSPGSVVEGVRRLLPSQALRLADGAVLPRALPAPGPGEPEALLRGLQARLTTGLRKLAAKGGPIALPLTGGHDSRTLLAAAVAAGVPVDAYTFEHGTISSADRDLPPRLAAAAGVPHRYIRRGPEDAGRLALWDAHTAGHAVDADRALFATGQLDAVAGAAFDLGDFYEVGRGYYDHVLPAEGPIADVLLRELPTPWPEYVREWAEWVGATPVAGLDWRDRFYLEQRLGGWLAAIDQGLDLAGVNKIHLASCTAFIAEGLSLPYAMRRAGVPHDELIRRMAPALSTFPVNPPGPPLERARHRVRRELLELRSGPDYVVRRARRLRTRLRQRP